jgi:hypothetical protein
MKQIYEDFFRELLNHSNELSKYVDSLYNGEKYTEEDLNFIFGVLKREGFIACNFADDRAWVGQITFEGKHYFDDKKLLVGKLRLE